MTRHDGRAPSQLRPVTFTPGFAPNATGSVLVSTGETRVICSAMVEEAVPRWMKEQQVPGGWVTAEYSMLPYSTLQRKQRDSSRGKVDGRATEIQRLIGRSMRAALDLGAEPPGDEETQRHQRKMWEERAKKSLAWAGPSRPMIGDEASARARVRVEIYSEVSPATIERMRRTPPAWCSRSTRPRPTRRASAATSP